MNDLHTPPGFVEYPRDKRFRPLDDIGRLELMSKGYATLLWAPIFATPLYLIPHTKAAFDLWVLVLSFVLLVCVVAILWSGLYRIFRAKGWSDRLAFVLSFVPAILYILRITRFFPEELLLTAFVAALVVIIVVAHRAVRGQYDKLDVKLPKAITSASIEKVVKELRDWKTRDSIDFVDRSEPSLADRLLDRAKVIRR